MIHSLRAPRSRQSRTRDEHKNFRTLTRHLNKSTKNFLLIFLCAPFNHKSRHAAHCCNVSCCFFLAWSSSHWWSREKRAFRMDAVCRKTAEGWMKVWLRKSEKIVNLNNFTPALAVLLYCAFLIHSPPPFIVLNYYFILTFASATQHIFPLNPLKDSRGKWKEIRWELSSCS